MPRDLNVGTFYITFLYGFSMNLNSEINWIQILKQKILFDFSWKRAGSLFLWSQCV